MIGQCKSASRWLSLGLAAMVCMVSSLDANAATKAKRVLLTGDSWPYFMYTGATFWTGCAAQVGMDQAGYSEWEAYGGSSAVGMSMAREWRDNLPNAYQGRSVGRLDILRLELAHYPTIDIVHVSLGGNDVGRGNYNDVMPQQIRFTGVPTGGTYTLSFEGQTTGALPFNATAAQIQAALESLSNIGTGKIQVTGPDGGPYFCVLDSSIVAYGGESAADNNISASSSLVGCDIIVDDARHGWEKSWGTDSDYEKMFFDAVCFGIEKVVKHILDTRPDIRVAVCDYDYLRVDWGGATELETRQAGMRLATAKYAMTQRVSAMPEYHNRCFFISPAGLMQYVFGLYTRYTYAGDPADGATLIYGPNGTEGATGLTISRPHSNPVPILGGDIDPPVDYYEDDRPIPYPNQSEPHTHDLSPRNVILPDVGGGDIHLNKLGYAALMQYCVEEFYGGWLEYPRALSVTPILPKATAENAKDSKSGVELAAFQVTFSEDVIGVDETDFVAVTHGGRAGASIISVTPGPSEYSSTYTVTVNCGSGTGTVTVDVLDNGTIKDDEGNTLSGDIDGGFSGGVLYNPASYSLPVAGLPAAALLACLGAWYVKRRKY